MHRDTILPTPLWVLVVLSAGPRQGVELRAVRDAVQRPLGDEGGLGVQRLPIPHVDRVARRNDADEVWRYGVHDVEQRDPADAERPVVHLPRMHAARAQAAGRERGEVHRHRPLDLRLPVPQLRQGRETYRVDGLPARVAVDVLEEPGAGHAPAHDEVDGPQGVPPVSPAEGQLLWRRRVRLRLQDVVGAGAEQGVYYATHGQCLVPSGVELTWEGV